MPLFKRRREDSEFESFVSDFEDQLEQYDLFSSMTVSDKNIELEFPSVENLPLSVISKAQLHGYQLDSALRTSKDSIILSLKYSSQNKKSNIKFTDASIQFPQEVVDNLGLKNKKLISHITTFMQKACSLYSDQMNWSGTHIPYKFIYQKKHNMLVCKIEFKKQIPIIVHDIKSFSDHDCWIEYDNKLDFFSLVKVFQECV